MQIKYCVVLMAMAGSAAADARFTANDQVPAGNVGLVYAQIQVDSLPASDLRRLVFYADRATRTLQNLAEGAENPSIDEQDTANKRFRDSILRLVDAGARSGLSIDQVADYYAGAIYDTFSQDLVQKVGIVIGGLDFRALFRKISATPAPRATVNDGSNNTLSTAPHPEGPIAPPNANAIELGIIKRVIVTQGKWELTIKAGDSLSTIASAIYGDPASYTIIYNANADTIGNPNVVEVGTVLILPKP